MGSTPTARTIRKETRDSASLFLWFPWEFNRFAASESPQIVAADFGRAAEAAWKRNASRFLFLWFPWEFNRFAANKLPQIVAADFGRGAEAAWKRNASRFLFLWFPWEFNRFAANESPQIVTADFGRAARIIDEKKLFDKPFGRFFLSTRAAAW